jgi:hypothetical protein
MCLLIYIHFPSYASVFHSSFQDVANVHEPNFYQFGRKLYACLEYFGDAMREEMVVYHALALNNNNSNNNNNNNNNAQKQAAAYVFDFFNTAFLSEPLSCTTNLDIANNFAMYADFSTFLILELKSQFVNDFNDTRCLDISDLCSNSSEQQILFWGEWGELSIQNIITVDQESGQAMYPYTDWMKGMKYWQKLTSGFADFNVRKFNLGFELDEKTQAFMCRMARRDADVPPYMQQLFDYYCAQKTGVAFHKMYTAQLDIDFGKIIKKAFKHMTSETRELLFNEDVSDIDPQKIKQFFRNGVKYRDTLQRTYNF